MSILNCLDGVLIDDKTFINLIIMNDRRISRGEVGHNLLNLRQLTLEVTDACNLRCQYCGYGGLYSGYDERKSSYMSMEQVRPLIDYLAGVWRNGKPDAAMPLTYVSFYGGEPLLNMDFIKDLVVYVESLSLDRRIVYSMTTNAVLLDRYMDYLVEKDFHLLVSLDGDEASQGYRVDHSGMNSFGKVFPNIKRLQTRYPEYFKANVNFNSVLHSLNGVEGIRDFFKREFGKEPRISELNSSGVRPDKREDFERMYRNKSESLHQSEDYERVSEDMFMEEPSTHELLLFLHQYSGNVFKGYDSLLSDTGKLPYTPTGTCSPFSKKMFVTVNGKILQCEKIDHRFAFGKVSEAGVELDIDAIVDRYNGYLDKMQDQCSACSRKRNCIQCMYYIDTIDTASPVCHGFMDCESFARYSSRCLNHLRQHPGLYRRLMEEVTIE